MRKTFSIAMLLWSVASVTQASPLGLTHQLSGIESGQSLVSTVAAQRRHDGHRRGGGVRPRPGPVKAVSSLRCGKDRTTVGTGNDQGTCTKTGNKIECDDQKGNTATVSCAGGCLKTMGSAFCTIVK